MEGALRQAGVGGDDAMRSLIALVFIKLYEEKRALNGPPSRFTTRGLAAYRAALPEFVREKEYEGRTVQHLLEHGIKTDPDLAHLLKSVVLSPRIGDAFIENKVLPVLERHDLLSHLDPLGTVFEAVSMRGGKDTHMGQFFTPEPIVRFAVDIVRPRPTDVVLDPAVGTGRFLAASMEHMDAQAGEPPIAARGLGRTIGKEQLLGCDTDAWVATIARMNLYFQGSGRSRIEEENGLFLADAAVFGDAATQGTVDVCLTNPPLAAMSYREYANDFRRRHPCAYSDPAERLQLRLPVLPGGKAEERRIREAEARIERWMVRAREADARGDRRAHVRARERAARAEQSASEARQRLEANRGNYVVFSETAKGGALFLAAIRNYLKLDREPAAPQEWRGGQAGIILDEAILNTPEHAGTRRFIRRNYFVKAVFSFHRGAFWYQARTTAKTSLVYLVRKPDDGVQQQEPVFFGNIDRIGFTRMGKPAPTDLPHMLQAYRQFQEVVLASYRGGCFNERVAREALGVVDFPPEAVIQWPQEDAEDARLDYAAAAVRNLRARLPAGHPVLGDFVALQVRTPPEDPSGIYSFATVDRSTGEVRDARIESTEYPPSDLRVIQEGDIVLSGIDLVNGAVGYADRQVSGRVVSKEYYTLALRPECILAVDARYLATLLRTPRASAMVAGGVTGTSNRTRIQNASALLDLPLPPLPPIAEQRVIAAAVEKAHEANRTTQTVFAQLRAEVNTHWWTRPTGHYPPDV